MMTMKEVKRKRQEAEEEEGKEVPENIREARGVRERASLRKKTW